MGDFMLLKKTALGAVIIFSAVMLVLKKDLCAVGVGNALSLCFDVLIPSLFPFAVVADLAVNSGVFNFNGRAVSFMFKKLFGLPAVCLPAVIFGFVGGYPVGASIASQLYENGNITKNDAKKLLAFCVNAGPSFAVTAVGGLIFGSAKAGCVLLTACSIASLLTCNLARFFYKEDLSKKNGNSLSVKNNLLVSAVSSACNKTVVMCGWIILFSSFNEIVLSFFDNSQLSAVYSMFSEVTTGVGSAAKLGGLPLSAFCLSFGGFCVMCQLLPGIKKCGCKVKEYLAFRIVNGCFSFFLTKFLLLFVDVPVETASTDNFALWSISAPSAVALIVMCVVFVYDMAAKKPQKITLKDFG